MSEFWTHRIYSKNRHNFQVVMKLGDENENDSPQMAIMLSADEETARFFLRQRGILASRGPKCSLCSRHMTEVKMGRNRETMWRCPSHKMIKKSIKCGSFLEKHKIKMSTFIGIAFMWARETPVSKASRLCKISLTSSIQWYSQFRDICTNKLCETDTEDDTQTELEHEPGTDQLPTSDVASKNIKGHVDELLWRQRYGKNSAECFNNLLLHISQWYFV